MNRKILEERLVDFSIKVIELCRGCEFDIYTQHLSRQIVRSSSSTALNYGEAQSAESKADFAHKLSLVLKELRETQINLKLIDQSGICRDKDLLRQVSDENNELIAIFQKSVTTLSRSGAKKRR